MPFRTIVVRVDFPALTALVEYLQGQQQQQIDALTAQVTKLTQGLQQSTTGLQGSVDEAKAV